MVTPKARASDWTEESRERGTSERATREARQWRGTGRWAERRRRKASTVHAGIYYLPGSAKATLCRRGADLLRGYCADRGLPWDARGKLVVARDETETGRLREIERRATANRVPGLRWLDAAAIRELEPEIAGQAALLSPSTAITDYPAIARSLAGDVTAAGDQAAPEIAPFRGEYLRLRPQARHRVRHLIYPVPDPAYPFLGVHLTPRIDGEVDIGPNAVLALAREGYRRRDVSARQLARLARSVAFRKRAQRNWRAGVRELRGSLSRRVFLAEARSYLPWLGPGDVQAAPAGVRNAPSPAATASLAIAERIVAELSLPMTPGR
jgi:(S)-2-hydroxyglutarate dehydrogenase